MTPHSLFFPGYRVNNAGYTESVAKRWMQLRIFDSGYTGQKPKPLRGAYHPFSYEVADVQMTLEQLYYDGKSWKKGDHLHAATYGLNFPDIPSMNLLYNRALDELNEKTRGSLDLSVDIAEFGQTVKMFKITDQVIDFTRVFRRRFGTLKSAANAWLQYTYGVKPLLGSLYGVAEEIDRFVLNKTEQFRVRVVEKVPLGRFGYYSPNGYVYVPTDTRLKRSITLGVCLDQRDRDVTRLTSLNPLSIAWELTPYSFVADWFLDVGSYLRNLETSLLYANRFKSGFRTDLVALDGSFDYWSPYQPTGWNNHYVGSCRYRSVTRSVLSSYPVPRLPSFQVNLGSSRLLSAAALLSTLLKR